MLRSHVSWKQMKATSPITPDPAWASAAAKAFVQGSSQNRQQNVIQTAVRVSSAYEQSFK